MNPSIHSVFALAGALAILTAPAAAQLQFAELARIALPSNSPQASTMALGDVDGDGDLDILLGRATGTASPQRDRLLINQGGGAFVDETIARMPVAFLYTTAVAFGDVDGDGDLDIIIGSQGQGAQTRLYVNNGSGTFTDVTASQMPVDLNLVTSLALGDVDGDGDLDLVIGNGFYLQNLLYLNNGTGTFTDATVGRLPIIGDPTNSAVLGDVDGDGDLDLVVGNSAQQAGQSRLHLNDGTGVFLDATLTNMPLGALFTTSIALGDVDGDGDLDLVLGIDGQNRLYDNDGTGIFSDVTAARLPVDADSATKVALADMDGDGDLDLVIGNFEFSVGQQNRLYLNDGAGGYTDVTASRMPIVNDETGTLVLGDLDGDGDVDMLVSNGVFSGVVRHYTNLQRQLYSPAAPAIGQNFLLDVYMRHQPSGAVSLAIPVASFAPATTAVPPYGTLGLAQPLITLPLLVVPQSTGIASMNLAIPNYPWLVGVPIFVQALMAPYPYQPSFSNVVSEVLH
ncbi:MAG: VCBS repeat-containing protein [Planctomycetes bacterium]|nr:VCBS repeat-containing protein [Planctomycetota bacterium]MCB9884235.1 VCBS repeat-containing protein [Planctomycetota bacterium]